MTAKGKESLIKRKSTKAQKQSLLKRPRRKLVVTPNEEEEFGEGIESNDLRKLQIVPKLPLMTID